MSEQVGKTEELAFSNRLKGYLIEHTEGGEDQYGDSDYTGRWLIAGETSIVPVNCVEFTLEERRDTETGDSGFNYVRTDARISFGVLEGVEDEETFRPLYTTSFITDNLVDSDDAYFETYGSGGHRRVRSTIQGTLETILKKLQAAEADGKMIPVQEPATA